ncbi:hypothetical protein H9P43_008192 [Blastocladiella emersonii ATCC 22665]|nr:hypothetical protein H9P43_008192 [Blastocladiella emersonii ATCC 22665]
MAHAPASWAVAGGEAPRIETFVTVHFVVPGAEGAYQLSSLDAHAPPPRECLYVFSQAHNQTLEDTIVANAHRKYMVEINETRVAFAWNMLVVSQVALLPFRRTQ